MAKNGTLKNLRILIHDLLKRKGKSFNDDGLSILELVVAMGIILVITGTSIGVYNGINSNAKHAAVTRAADQVLKAAMLFESDGLDDTKAIDDVANDNVAKQWMKSAGSKNKVEVTIERDDDGEFVVNAGYGADSSIFVSRSVNPNGSTCIDGILVGGKNTGDACVSGEKDPEIPGPAIGDTVSRLTYNCDTDTTGYLAAADIVAGTKITMAGADGSSKLVKYSNKSYKELFDASANRSGVITDKVTMKKGIKYTIVINGQFGKLLSPRDADQTKEDSLGNCLVAVNKIAEDSEIKELSAFGLNKLESVPDKIPEKVTSLRNVFRGASIFNDPNVSEWDISNVDNLYYGLGLARKFNQPLNDWNVSKGEDMYALFYGMYDFNQPLDKWNTGSAKNMRSMFAGNSKVFNQDISMWDTSNVTDMRTMFSSNKIFDQNLSGWNVDKVALYTDFNDGSILATEKLPKFKN